MDCSFTITTAVVNAKRAEWAPNPESNCLLVRENVAGTSALFLHGSREDFRAFAAQLLERINEEI
jgi:hypothetical protein